MEKTHTHIFDQQSLSAIESLKNSYGSISARLKSHSSAFLISRYILPLGQRGRYCFCAACSNRKMYLEMKSANEGALRWFVSCCSKCILSYSQRSQEKQPKNTFIKTNDLV